MKQDVLTPSALAPGGYHAGRIENEYCLFLPGERRALAVPPRVHSIRHGALMAELGGHVQRMRIDDELEGWRLLAIVMLDGAPTAVFEKHVTHRGAIVYVSEKAGVVAHIPKQIGALSAIRPRPTNTPHGVKFERRKRSDLDTAGDYLLNSADDPSYETVAALGAEYVGWTLVANEEGGPLRSLYIDATGRSRQVSARWGEQGLWGPDAAGPVFDPTALMLHVGLAGFSKRTLLGGYLPSADLGIWNPKTQAGTEVMMLLPPGADAKPIARLRSSANEDQHTQFAAFKQKFPSSLGHLGTEVVRIHGQRYFERYWGGTAEEFYLALARVWDRWRSFHEGGMQVEIPDEWLLDAARAGLTLCRCSYTGLEPTYQMGEGFYTKVPPSSHALFPVAHYEFVWAHQLWNHCADADRYFQHYLDHYILPSGEFVYNTQEQVEAPLNAGVFAANSARSFSYTGNLQAFDARRPIIERMLAFVLGRYEYSKARFPVDDPRHGLIWGSPEADTGNPRDDEVGSHPFYYQNAVWIWRGLHEHAKALALAAKLATAGDHAAAAARYETLAREMRQDIEASMKATLSKSTSAMRVAGITPFTPDDINREPSELEDFENHRFMEDWFLADWGDPVLDLGHLKHRRLANMQVMGLGTSDAGVGVGPAMTSNFLAHGTLSVLIRQEDYRPFLLALYALCCYTADSGNRYSPEDAYLPGGHPLEGRADAWSAVINSTLQPTMGLRWLLCYEDWDRDVCHLQKAAPKHWFGKGQKIAVARCPTRSGPIGWSTEALSDRSWKVLVELPAGFSSDLVIHVHPMDGRPLEKTSLGVLHHASVLLPRDLLKNEQQVQITVS